MKYTTLLLLALFAFACGENKKDLIDNAPLIAADYTDDTGRKVHLPHRVETVASIAPSITEMVFAIGGQKKLIARSQACDYPEAVDSIPKVMTYPNLDVEKLVSMKPDLVLTTDEIFTPDGIAALEAKGLKIYLQSYKTMGDVYRCMRDLGKILECEKQANLVADSLQNIEKQVEKETKDLAKYHTMILVSDEPLKVIGGTGYLNELIEKAGGLNIFKDKKEGYPTTTVEEIMMRQPEYLIIPSEDPEIYTKLLMLYPYLHNTPADIQHHIFIVEPDVFYRPGPRTTEALLILTNILHSSLTPDKFK
jgi:iron complex transport system substrate-binding protein